MRGAGSHQQGFRQLLWELPEAVLVLVGGRIKFSNRAAVRLLGAESRAHLRNSRYSDFVLTRSAMPNGSEHHKLRRADGQVIDAEALMRGSQQKRLLLLRDMTHMLSSENALRRSEERFRIMSENMHDRAIITLDAIGYIVHWNEAAQHVTGFRDEQTIGHSFSVLFTEEQVRNGAQEALLRAAIEQGRSGQEGWMRKADGSHYYGFTSVITLFDRDRKVNGFAVILRDLSPNSASEVLRNEEQIRQAQRMEAVGRLASGVAHDFNNLLTAIQGHAQFMLEDLPDHIPSRADAEEILLAAERAAGLTRQLLAFSRGHAIQPHAVDLNQVVVSMERLLRRVINENITLETVLHPDLDTVRADPSQIEQVLVNLVVNARDAMPRGGVVTIKTSNVELADQYAQQREEVTAGNYVMLAVTDTGTGMDAETQAHIFEPFFTTKDADKGTGLGLSTVYAIVRQSGGHIFCYSEPDKGTTFKIYLPADGHMAAEQAARRRREQAARIGETILIVEDDAGVRGLAKRVLQTRGYRVLTAESAAEARSVLKLWDGSISLLISDVVLPDITGMELLDEVQQVQPGCKMLLMSGYTSEAVQRQDPGAANRPFMEKPFTPDALANKVRELLDS